MAASTNLSSSDLNELFERLIGLDKCLESAGSNKHDRAHLLINACILGGIVSGTKIVGVLVKLGFDRRHVGVVLKAGTQVRPEWPEWGRRPDGTYFAPTEE